MKSHFVSSILSVTEWQPDVDPLMSKHVAAIKSTWITCVNGFYFFIIRSHENTTGCTTVKLRCWKVPRLSPLVLLIRAVIRSRRLWNVAAMVLTEKLKHSKRKTAPEQIWPPLMSHALAQDQTWASAKFLEMSVNSTQKIQTLLHSKHTPAPLQRSMD